MPRNYTNKEKAAEAGRKSTRKGVKNEKTKQWEALGDAIINQHAERFNKVLEELDPKDFVTAYTSILQYFQPKRTQNDNQNATETVIRIENVSKQYPEK